MDFWLLDVKSTREVDGEKVAFDYINTYLSCDKAIKEAKLLSLDKENVLEVSVHHWILKSDETQEHTGDIPYRFLNRNHWELKKMELTAENVEKIFEECFLANEDKAIKCEAVVHTFPFSNDKLQENKQNIIDMLSCLPKEFMENTGGGWSFLAACNDKDGNQWTGLHLTMEKLFALGIGIEKVKCLLPRELWKVMPGGMPYFVVLD